MNPRQLISGALCAAFAALTLSCNSPVVSDAGEFGDIIESFSPSRIPSCGSIRVDFKSPAVPGDSATFTSPEKLFRFKPAIRGEAVWSNGGRTLEFHPEKGTFSSGQTYFCTLKTGKIFDGRKDFTFKFGIAKKECRFTLSGVSPDYDDEDSGEMLISCSLTLSEPSSYADIGKLISCRMLQDDVKVDVSKLDETEYLIRIKGVKQEEKERTVNIRFDARKMGFRPVGEVTATIPAAKKFEVAEIRRVNCPAPYVKIEFTESLDVSQDLTGLVSVDETDDISIQRGGNSIKLFIPTSLEAFTLRISKDVRSSSKAALGIEEKHCFEAEEIPPQVEIPLSGTILPDRDRFVLPFEAVNLRAVDVSVIKIYSSNVLHFLQENELDGSDGVRRAGRLVYRKTARLDSDASLDLHRWNKFSVDLSGAIRKEKGALYRIRLSFKKEYSLYGQEQYGTGDPIPEECGVTEADNARWDRPESYYDCLGEWDWDEYDWSESDDPDKPSYFMNNRRFPSYNLAASDIGLIVKSSGKGRLWTSVSNILTAAPMQGVKVTAYNYQLRIIGSGISSGDGFADFQVNGQPFIVTASAGGYTTYLKVTSGKEKSLSRFDVGGKKVVKGVKGYAYGERGVWRPGDTLHVTFVMEDKNRKIPENHPVELVLRTPEGQFYDRYVQTEGKDGFYVFTIPTRESDPTGNWKAEFNAGGSVFRKDLRMETVKPNRLKINFEFGGDAVRIGRADTVSVESHWLTGPAASGMYVSLEMSLNRLSKPFKTYEDYVFDNPVSDFKYRTFSLGTGHLDSLGRCRIPFSVEEMNDAPGMLEASVSCRVLEPGGGFSICSQTGRFSPYASYAGIRFTGREFETDSDIVLPVVCLDENGRPVSGRELHYKIYSLGWNWWWETFSPGIDSYIHGNSAEIVDEGSIKTSGEDSSVRFRVNYPSTGKFLIIVKDKESGHTTGGTIFVDCPLRRGNSDKSDPSAISMLSFNTDKKSYEVGETVKLYLPAADGGNALVSLENAGGVISRRWVGTSGTSVTVHEFTVTEEMTPNFYVHVSLIQPHRNTVNDLPIRMYGVRNLTVTDKGSYLHPVIDAPTEVEPNQQFTIKVREQDGRPMTYTLAIVDEGLLDLTAFRTPDIRAVMNAREALGVKTWDIYDEVIGASSGSWSKVLSIGGDEGLHNGARQDNRFKPVVAFYGPFTLSGGTAPHGIRLPMYTGSVRIMLVAGHGGAYGNAEKTMAVRSPLMVVPTLPRTLVCGDAVKFPVNVFATEDCIGKVDVDVKVSGPLKLEGAGTARMNIGSSGDGMVTFGVKADDFTEGTAEVVVTARSGRYTASDRICINISNPNATELTVRDSCLAAGSSMTMRWTPFKAGSRESVSLETRSFPAISFTDAFNFVQNYGYLCTEQLSSMGMFLLHGAEFLSTPQREEAQERLQRVISELYTRQLSDGGFAYWPGENSADEWATSMAGQVLVEAGRRELAESGPVISRWKEYQKKKARSFRRTSGNLSDLQQAYRLYTMALSGEADAAAMNRLKENPGISYQARMRLAAAYAVSGKSLTAKELFSAPSDEVQNGITDRYYTFQDRRRDEAMVLETLVLLGERAGALKKASAIAESFSSHSCSTQELAFTSLAMGRLAEDMGTGQASASVDGEKVDTDSGTTVLDSGKGSALITNTGQGDVHIRLVERHLPSVGTDMPATQNGVAVSVSCTDELGRSVSPSRLLQGQDFYVNIIVKDLNAVPGERNMALTFPCPAGWEIWNDRLHGGSVRQPSGKCRHLDIRDDKVQWFFPLGPGQTRTFRIKAIAAYEGDFYGAPVRCEDMYDSSYHSRTSNYRTSVSK